MKNLAAAIVVLTIAMSAADKNAAKHRIEPEPQKLPLSFSPETSNAVKVFLKKGRIVLQVNQDKAVDVGELDTGAGMTGNKPVITADFNFDGATDLAVLDGIGYNGVNMFYRLYLWEKGKKRFREIKEPIGNPVLFPQQKLIVSAQRSGPRWYQTLYKIVNGDVYLFAQGQMLNSGDLWGVTFPDERGELGERAVVKPEWFDAPVIPVEHPEAYYSPFYCNGEKVPAKGSAQDKKKELVTLVDFRDDGAELLIQAKGKKETRWVNGECVIAK